MPGGGGGGSLLPPSSTSGSFNGAAFAGFRIEKSKWSTDDTVLWAGLSAERSSNPFARINVNIIYGQLMVGREVLPDLFLEGGFLGFRRPSWNTVDQTDSLIMLPIDVNGRSPDFVKST